MAKANVTAAVQALARNPRLMRLFRKKPEKALVRFHLSESEVGAIKEGSLAGLVAAGMDARIVTRRPTSPILSASLLLRHGPKLAAPVFLAWALMLWPSGTALASPPEGRTARGIRTIRGIRARTLGRRIGIRRLERAGARRARARLGALIRRTDIGLKRALRRVGGDLDDDNGGVD